MRTRRQALKPRLLVPVSLAAGMAAYNHFAQQQPLQGIEQASLLAGFLSYKVTISSSSLLSSWPEILSASLRYLCKACQQGTDGTWVCRLRCY